MKRFLHNRYFLAAAILLGLIVVGQVAVTQLGKRALNRSDNMSVEEQEKAPTLLEIAEGVKTGDDPVKELGRIIKAYKKQKAISFTGKVKLYKDEGETPVEESSFVYKKEGEHELYTIGPVSFVSENGEVLYVDQESRIIQLTIASEESGNKQMNRVNQFDEIKKYMEQDSAEAVVTKTDKEKIITIINSYHPSVQQYVIHYSTDTYMITEINMVMYKNETMDESDFKAAEEEINKRKEERQKNSSDTLLLPEELGYKQTLYQVDFIYDETKLIVDWIAGDKISDYISKQGKEYTLKDPYKEFDFNY